MKELRHRAPPPNVTTHEIPCCTMPLIGVS